MAKARKKKTKASAPETIEVVYQGQPVEAVRVSFKIVEESLGTYLLENGTRLRFKAVVTDIVRVLDRITPEGTPVYVLRSKNVADVLP